VLHPIGWDAFGLPAEQHAVKTGTHPAANTQNNIVNFRRQIKALGFSYDWDREVDTTDPKYFRWTQWIFLQLFKKGLAYVDERPVWWCPELRTVLANEEVVDGKSEVGGFPVERRNLRQWVLRITAYAERLLADLKDVDWPDSTKRMQEAWIGRSEGAEVCSSSRPGALGDLKVFTTRPDTLFGCTYMVLAPEHPLVDALTTPASAAVAAYKKKAAAQERPRAHRSRQGQVRRVHRRLRDQPGQRRARADLDRRLRAHGLRHRRDHGRAGARRARLRIRPQVRAAHRPGDRARTGPRRSCPTSATAARQLRPLRRPRLARGEKDASPPISPPAASARPRSTTSCATGCSPASATGASRSRSCGSARPTTAGRRRAGADLPAAPVTFTQDGVTHYALPLPDGRCRSSCPRCRSYLPSGTAKARWPTAPPGWRSGSTRDRRRRARHAAAPAGDTWVRARRETNTMPQWAGSCWYYLRYLDPRNDQAIADPARCLLGRARSLRRRRRARRAAPALRALLAQGALRPRRRAADEPFKKLFHQGIILGEDGEKMSKSRGNVVSPDDDHREPRHRHPAPLPDVPRAARGHEAVESARHRGRAPLPQQKVWRECVTAEGEVNPKISDAIPAPRLLTRPKVERLLHETIKKVGADIEEPAFSTPLISQMMIFVNALASIKSLFSR
jgi:leucyl-tRNA synthetase